VELERRFELSADTAIGIAETAAWGRRLPSVIPLNERLLVGDACSKAAGPLTASSGRSPCIRFRHRQALTVIVTARRGAG
jgi:hypothetical protein